MHKIKSLSNVKIYFVIEKKTKGKIVLIKCTKSSKGKIGS